MTPTPNFAPRRQPDPVDLEQLLAGLAGALEGTLVTPASPDFDTARLAWALSVDQRPVAVAFPHSPADVQKIVDFARLYGYRVAPQGTGHNAHPLEHRLADTILLKTDRMRKVDIDPENRTARVEAGAVWLDVTVPAGEHGLAALAGSSPDVGVVGYTLGGGLSWLGRRYGLAANSVTAIEAVTADGQHVRVDSDTHPDLFWALRGGGGSFAVVTAIELQLYPVSHVYAGVLFFPQERAREVLQTWRAWTGQRELPEEITSVGRILNVPPFPEIPEPLRGRQFAVIEVIYLGPEAEGAALIAPLRELGPEIDTIDTIATPALSYLHMDPDHPVPGKGDGMLFGELPIDAIDAFVDATTGERGSALLSAEIRQLGGAIARPAPGHGAIAAIEAPFIAYAVGAAPTAEIQAVVEAQVNGVKQAMEPYTAPYGFMNFTERPVDGRALYADDYTYRRLQAVKHEYDRADVIQSNHPIRPAGR